MQPLVPALVLALAPVQGDAAAPPERPVVRAVRVDAERFVLDADPSEWRGTGSPQVVIEKLEQLVPLDGDPAETWSGPEDASLRMWVGWSEEDLYLGGVVYDDVIDHQEETWYLGDSLELFLNAVDRDPEWGPDDYQLMLAPDWRARPWGLYSRDSTPAGVPGGAAGFGGVEVSAFPRVGGFQFEVRIPWRNFSGLAPAAGDVLPFNVAFCDRDGRGSLESYGTWTGESGIAFHADRRGELHLVGGPELAGPLETGTTRLPLFGSRSSQILLLAAMYVLALATRGIWKSARARRAGVIGFSAVVFVAIAFVVASHLAAEGRRADRAREIERYWERFEDLARSGALGNPGPDELGRMAEALLAGRGVDRIRDSRFQALAPESFELAPAERTSQRALPFSRLVGPDGEGRLLAPGDVESFRLAEPLEVDALHLVAMVDDPRYHEVETERAVLSIELLRNSGTVEEIGVRHARELLHAADAPRPGLGIEPAFTVPGGARGLLQAYGILLPIDPAPEVDELVVRHVGEGPGYGVRLHAFAVRSSTEAARPPEGLAVDGKGLWTWAGHDPSFEAEVVALGGAPGTDRASLLEAPLALGEEPVAVVHLFDARRPTRGGVSDLVVVGVLALIAPFLVTLLAQWLATRRRLRGKLGVGFAVSSAVPLLALTLLLDATLRNQHEDVEDERTQAALESARDDLDLQVAELEREAERLLDTALVRLESGSPWPADGADLAEWLRLPEDDHVRLFEITDAGGRRRRIGAGPGWEALPREMELASGFQRPWGALLATGVHRTPAGADTPVAVLVAGTPRVPGSAGAHSYGVRLIGAGRDPRPTSADLSPEPGERRAPLYTPGADGLAGVLAVRRRERGVPVIGEFSLTELLLAAGLTAAFTALLFAGILTGRIVGPIERLHAAVKSGSCDSIQPEVDDEIGTLTLAIRSFTGEVAQRVRQLETLQMAQAELSSRLDFDEAREAVLAFFRQQTGADRPWCLWYGVGGEEPRLHGIDGRNRALPSSLGFFARVLEGGEAPIETLDPAAELTRHERLLLSGSEGELDRALGLPLFVGGEHRGAILLGFQGGAPAPDLAFLRAAAAQAAIVLENARLYQEAVRDAATGFLTDPGFRQRLGEEVQRAEGQAQAGVLLVRLRLAGLPSDDEVASARLAEAARRLRWAVRGVAIFGRSGAADLSVALPWTGAAPDFEAEEQRLVERVSTGPWPDGEPVTGLFAAHAAWPTDGPSGRFVARLLEERLVAVQSGPAAEPVESEGAPLPERFIAESPHMVQLLDTLRRLAPQDVTVLVSGETGVGKERIAELVHAWSRRSEGPLLRIHCPGLPEGLIEEQLFGHEAGAYTGATERRAGPFEEAAGGTVLLDEVAGLSSDGQVALLRLLETREVVPVGGTRPVPLDVRVVATTSENLAKEVERGRFRSDLFYRLNVTQVTVPPLRLRRADLPSLARLVLEDFNRGEGRPVTGIVPAALDRLHDYDWPGNVRELENVLRRALILAAGGELAPEHLEIEPEGEIHAEPVTAWLTQRQEATLRSLEAGGRISSKEYAEAHGVSTRTALRDLNDLVARGWLVREGSRRATRFRRTPRPLGGVSGH